VKFSSRQSTSGCVEPTGKDGLRGEFEGVWRAAETMPHIGQPGFGANAMMDDVGDDGGRGEVVSRPSLDNLLGDEHLGSPFLVSPHLVCQNVQHDGRRSSTL
jgi:hypothetical protein